MQPSADCTEETLGERCDWKKKRDAICTLSLSILPRIAVIDARELDRSSEFDSTANLPQKQPHVKSYMEKENFRDCV
jgi:hypothetical protein